MAKVFMRSPNGEVFETSNPEYHKECERLSREKGKAARKEYCRAKLREMIQPGQKVYCVLRSVSSSGMSRRISVFIINDNELRNIDGFTSDAIGWTNSDKGGLVASGCGMDMGFALVYALGAALWPNGTPAPHGKRNGEPDSDGGYALKPEWI